MAKLRHIALAVRDPEKAARFYQQVFGMARVGQTDSALATGVYLSDGTVNLALLHYKNDDSAGLDRGKAYVGAHHFGFIVDDLDHTRRDIEDNGGEFFLELPEHKDTLYYEQKYRDPDGIIFDISQKGWVGTKP
ncbi:MAG TPA: VOC family protein [Alphaproteobacteria bacterium]|nr:VOC family protein [Alphaproteobacteria bacterium]